MLNPVQITGRAKWMLLLLPVLLISLLLLFRSKEEEGILSESVKEKELHEQVRLYEERISQMKFRQDSLLQLLRQLDSLYHQKEEQVTRARLQLQQTMQKDWKRLTEKEKKEWIEKAIESLEP